MVKDDLLWSEYKTTFCEPTNCMLNYIISKGYCLDKFNAGFEYDQFKNYFSSGMENTYIGLKDLSVHIGLNINTPSKQICYMSEIMFNNINLKLEAAFTQSEFDNALSRFLLGNTTCMKRGIYLVNSPGPLTIVITNHEGSVQQYSFNKHKGYMHCKLELVKIKNYYNEEFIPVEQKKIILTKLEVNNEIVNEIDNKISKLKLSISNLVQENQELIYGMLEEISELKEHNKCLSERILSLENKPPIILI